MQIDWAGLSDVGLQREHNEDSFCVLPEYDLFVVADGMGGHRAGDLASRLATSTIHQFFHLTANEDATWPFHFDPSKSRAENRLVSGIKLANKRIFEASVTNQAVQGMGTTVVAVLFERDSGKVLVAHVGDSRAYLIRDSDIKLVTRDHSLLNDYLEVMPDMPPEQVEELPRNVITRALGMQDVVTVDIQDLAPEAGDRWLLCSDGLNGMLKDEQILAEVMEAGADLEAGVNQLIERANAAGGEDNTTVVLCGCQA